MTVVITLHCSVLDGAIHAFDLAIGPGMIDLGQAMPDAQSITQAIKGDCPVSFRAFTLGELNAVIRQNGVDFCRARLWSNYRESLWRYTCGARMKCISRDSI